MDNQSVKQQILEIRNLKTWFPIKRGIMARTAGYVKAGKITKRKNTFFRQESS